VETSFFAILGLGLVLGLKHATDADHVVAVTTFVSREKSLVRSCWIGLFWGAGHTFSLAVAGAAIILLKFNISERMGGLLEFFAAMMLIVLGARVVREVWKDHVHLHRHAHTHAPGSLPHEHWHAHLPGRMNEHSGWLHVGLRPLVVGMIHGAAGSGALMLLVLSTISSPLQCFLYIVIFGVGSIAGMLGVTLLLSLPLRWTARHSSTYHPIPLAAGLFSCLFGIYLGFTLWERIL